VDVGIAGERETDRTKLYGPSLSLQFADLNQGQGAVARASAMLDDARARVQSLDLEVEHHRSPAWIVLRRRRKITEDYRAH